jgi:argininosuccinate lyase
LSETRARRFIRFAFLFLFDGKKTMEEKFPARIYKENVLADCFETPNAIFCRLITKSIWRTPLCSPSRELLPKRIAIELLGALCRLDFDSIRRAEYDGSFEDLFYYLQREITKNCDADTAGKLHTARSRNDIDVTIYRLYLANGNAQAFARNNGSAPVFSISPPSITKR